MNLVSEVLSPFILVGFILIALAGMAGVKPESFLAPVFGLIGLVIKAMFELLIAVIRAIASATSAQHRHPFPSASRSSSKTANGRKSRYAIHEDLD